MRHDGLALGSDPIGTDETTPVANTGARLRELVDGHYDFVWRSLRRLGVADGDIDDAAQQVFCTAARKLAAIRSGSARAFLFQTALRVAADSRRSRRRRREVAEDEIPETNAAPEPALAPDDVLDLRRARKRLDEILDEMSLELRAVFVLFELDEATTAEISILLGLPAGTVASRLRRARHQFREAVARMAETKTPPGGAT
jgi:RNA polymerase sigma-70 factor (ECF subfamily)